MKNVQTQSPTQLGTDIKCGLAHQAGKTLVILQLGSQQVALEPVDAQRLGSNILAAAGIAGLSVDELRRMASALDSGLVLPPGVTPVSQ